MYPLVTQIILWIYYWIHWI